MKYEPIIGLEVHLQSKTNSKMFCSCSADYFGADPNTHTCPVCLGLPGALPVPNKKAIDLCVKFALALNCTISKETKFDRKNYFYPDLPKGYQISQYDQPVGYEGYLEIDIEGDARRIRITRVHQEEDTGKSIHKGDKTMLDFNKSGVPLIEIVSEPDMTSKEEVVKYAKRMRQIARYLNISNGDMEKGEMRFELNMSLRKFGDTGLPDYKIEVKNIGSISVLEKVIETEYQRQSELLDQGITPEQETRGLKDMTGATLTQRMKEESADYRYFPEPDIPPICFEDEYVEEIKNSLVELPQEKKWRYIKDFELEPDTAETIVVSLKRYKYFEKLIDNETDKKLIAELAKWFIGDYAALEKSGKFEKGIVSPEHLKELIQLLLAGKITGKAAKKVLEECFKIGKMPSELVKELGLETIQDEGAVEEAVKKVIENNQKVVSDLEKNPNAIGFLVGQVMRETKGKADPKLVTELLKKNI